MRLESYGQGWQDLASMPIDIPLTPLDPWIAESIDRLFLRDAAIRDPLRIGSRDEIERAQNYLLRRLIRHASLYSPFYRDRLDGKDNIPLEELPFISPSDLAQYGQRFLTVSQSEIRRVVTLWTSGTSSIPKRVFLTDDDIEATREFFLHGMTTFTAPESRVAVFMEGASPDSIGDVLRSALDERRCETRVFGLVDDPAEAASNIDEFRPSVVVGLPVQMAKVAALSRHEPESVLLSADIVPWALRRRIKRLWGCRVFSHYGLTESGWGCAVECQALRGCHVRELDVLLEIVDEKGNVLPDGEWGEVVITMIRRLSFPLIRYRTNDEGRVLKGSCPCGSPLKRIEVKGRLPERGAGGVPIRLYDVEEILWNLPWVEDFRLSLQHVDQGHATLFLTIAANENRKGLSEEAVDLLKQCPGMPEKIIAMVVDVLAFESPKGKRDWEN